MEREAIHQVFVMVLLMTFNLDVIDSLASVGVTIHVLSYLILFCVVGVVH